MKALAKTFVVVWLALVFVAAAIGAMLELGPAALDLRAPVTDHLTDTGVSHPVTAVLLNYRGYDTLLEIAVLLLALLGILAAGGAAGSAAPKAAHPMLQASARLAAPLMILVAVYLLWAGAFLPGGAFQAGAVLAAAAVLLHLVGLTRGWDSPRLRLRLGLAGGFALFLAVAAALLTQGALLGFPPAWAGELIMLIEAGLTVSLGLILAGFFLFLSRDLR
ncbi:MnhB domain-containing protein [Thiorhodococcus minor]|uniref:Sodium:proton antiporter n=1 Tax=Thiorhodococcus minor TaxID=57489 RepID=A0A6M0K1G5_9GAMM|nr:MnhB domain-containing protein [Thiorhodococcus minor]NEV63229.1 sodium:proton antiporter [Thiorhodococcus minor]